MKTPKGMYEVVVHSIEGPTRIRGKDGRLAYGYVYDAYDMKKIFGLEGFNIAKPSWRQYIETWVACDLMIKDPDSDTFFLTERGLLTVRGGVSRMRELRSVANDHDALVIA